MTEIVSSMHMLKCDINESTFTWLQMWVHFHLYIVLNLNNEWGKYYYSHLTDQETEAQKVQTISGWEDDLMDKVFVTHASEDQSLDL